MQNLWVGSREGAEEFNVAASHGEDRVHTM